MNHTESKAHFGKPQINSFDSFTPFLQYVRIYQRMAMDITCTREIVFIKLVSCLSKMQTLSEDTTENNDYVNGCRRSQNVAIRNPLTDLRVTYFFLGSQSLCPTLSTLWYKCCNRFKYSKYSEK